MGDGAGGSHPGRSRRSGQHPARRSPRSSSGSTDGELHALVNNAAISPKAEGGKRLSSIDTTLDVWQHVFQVNFFAPIMLARGLLDELKAAKGSVVNVTSIAGSRVHPFAGAAYCDLEGGARRADPRDGRRLRPARHPRQRHRAGRDRHRDPVARHRGDRRAQIPLHRLGTPDEVAKIIYVLCTETSVLRERRRDPHQRRPARLAREFIAEQMLNCSNSRRSRLANAPPPLCF